MYAELRKQFVRVHPNKRWLRYKRKMDDIGDERLWRVHGGLYDLKEFMDKVIDAKKKQV